MRLPIDLPPGADSDDWYTPPYIFEALELTDIDLDPAAPINQLPWIPSKQHFSWHDDGLLQPWTGFVWLNPPYSNPRPWLERFHAHRNGLALVPADPASKWFRMYGATGPLLTLHDRVTFIQEGNTNTTTARFPSALIGLGVKAWSHLQTAQRNGLGYLWQRA